MKECPSHRAFIAIEDEYVSASDVQDDLALATNCWRFLKYTFHTANMHTNSIKYHQTLEIGFFYANQIPQFW